MVLTHKGKDRLILFNASNSILFNAGNSMESCLQTGIYHMPKTYDPPIQEFRFIGLYKNRAIHYAGEFEGKIIGEEVAAPEQEERIKKCLEIERTIQINRHLLNDGKPYIREDLVFYLVKKIARDKYFYETQCRKRTNGGTWRTFAYLCHKSITEQESAETLARFMNGKTYAGKHYPIRVD